MIFYLLNFLVKATPTDKDDEALRDLEGFLKSNPDIASELLSIFAAGLKINFDTKNKDWMHRVINFVFTVIRSKYE